MSRNEIEEILTKYKTIAVVGLSREPNEDSYGVSEYLKRQGFRIIPVNPFTDDVLGEKSYKSLLDIPPETQKTIEIVDIFRPAEDVPPIVAQAVALKQKFGKPYIVWMQIGVINEEAAETTRKVRLMVVMDKCMMVEHCRLC